MSGVLSALGQTAYKTAFELSPIILTGGVAGSILGGALPIVAITQAADFVTGLLNGSIGGLDQFFAHFYPSPGSTLIDYKIGQYPFANQTVAANAIIAQPLKVSLTMACPVQEAGGYTAKLVTFIALQAVLQQHATAGGLYTVATPSFLWPNCILTRLVDISSAETKQPQTRWQFDFEQPLITLQAAAEAQNSLMSKISSGAPTDGSLSGPSSAAGNVSSNSLPFTGGMAGGGLGG